MENIHKGHRDRLKSRYCSHGLDSFNDIEALELMLFFALPRCDTNEIAHRLLNRFRDFRGVMEADIDDLKDVKGVGENAALLLNLVRDMNRRYLSSACGERRKIEGSEDAGAYFLPMFAYLNCETVFMLCLDSASRVLCCRSVAKGMANKVDVSVRDMVSIALRENAAGVIIAHNHLSGTALPSSSDIDTTAKLAAALRLIGVELRDHIIVCDDDFVSLRDSGYYA